MNSFEFNANLYNVFLSTANECLLEGHQGNCKSGIRVCVACVRNSFLNPIQCHSCRGKLTSIVGKEKVSVSSSNKKSHFYKGQIQGLLISFDIVMKHKHFKGILTLNKCSPYYVLLGMIENKKQCK